MSNGAIKMILQVSKINHWLLAKTQNVGQKAWEFDIDNLNYPTRKLF
jgi:hypothetical protein